MQSIFQHPIVDTHADDKISKAHDENTSNPLVTVIIAVYNAAEYLDETLESVFAQTYRPIEVGCFDDGSTDASLEILQRWQEQLAEVCAISMYILHSPTSHGGPSYPRNQLIEAAHGEYLCILDADDMMEPNRIERQLTVARADKTALVGSDFRRIPDNSTPYYADWVCGLDEQALYLQRFRECTIICPTWFMHRDVFSNAGKFQETSVDGQPPPEDLIFFHEHLSKGGKLLKVPLPLVCYRYRPFSMSSLMSKRTLQKIRMHYLITQVLCNWSTFMIWGCGNDGKWFYNRLPPEIGDCVVGFCEVDQKKIGHTYFCQRSRRHIPIVHFSEATPPIIICVASKRANGVLEENIASLELIEGRDYYHFM